MKTLRSFHLALLLGGLLGAGVAGADDRRTVDERRPLNADARVTVRNVAGTIDVEAWDRSELHLTGRLAKEVEELAIEGDATTIDIEVKIPRGRRRNVDDTDLKLFVPAGVRMEAEAVSADVRMRGIAGDVEASSVSGNVTLDVGSRRVKAESVSGDVDVRAPAAEAEVQSVSGDVIVTAATRVRGESVSGDVHVRAVGVRELRVNTVSGDLELDLALAKDAEVEAESLSGDVIVSLPSAPEGRIELESFSGSLRTAFGDAPGDAKRYRREGSGGGRVELNSHSGDVILRKR